MSLMAHSVNDRMPEDFAQNARAREAMLKMDLKGWV